MTGSPSPAHLRSGAGRVLVLSARWSRTPSETAFVIRQVAAAALRSGRAVDVRVPGAGSWADGAFDVVGVGAPSGTGPWPPAPACGEGGRAPGGQGPYTCVLVEARDHGALAYAGSSDVGHPRILMVGREPHAATTPAEGAGATTYRSLVADLCPLGAAESRIGVPVAVGASPTRWLGVRTGSSYVLVLGGAPTSRHSPAEILARRFPRHLIVQVDGGVATAWHLRRQRRHRAGVHTRADLQRLLAHASLTVDSQPGRVLARECVESLRYGVPVVVPAATPAACLAEAGGGDSYRDDEDLVAAVGALLDPQLRREKGSAGRTLVDQWYGDPGAFIRRVAHALEAS